MDFNCSTNGTFWRAAYSKIGGNGDDATPATGPLLGIDFVYVSRCSLPSESLWQPVLIALLFVLIFVLIRTIVNVASMYFSSTLEHMGEGLRVSKDCVGVTLLAFGNGAPDFFSLVVSASRKIDLLLAISSLLGAGVFLCTVVVGTIAVYSPGPVHRRVVLRDILFHWLSVTAVVFAVLVDVAHVWIGILFIGAYASYIVLVIYYTELLEYFDRLFSCGQSIANVDNEYGIIDEEEMVIIHAEQSITGYQSFGDVDEGGIEDSLEAGISAPKSSNTSVRSNSSSPCRSPYLVETYGAGTEKKRKYSIGGPGSDDDSEEDETAAAAAITFSGTGSSSSSGSGSSSGGHVGSTTITAAANSDRFGEPPNLKIVNPTRSATSDTSRSLHTPVHRRRTHSSSIVLKTIKYTVRLLELPLLLILDLTIPTLDSDKWLHQNILLMILQPGLCLLFIIFTSGFISSRDNFFLVIALVFILGSLVGYTLHTLNSLRRPLPQWGIITFLWLSVAFFMCVVWMYLLSGELLTCLVALGELLNVPHAFLGLSILAWGNSMSDFWCNTSIAVRSLDMALAGSYAGPIFNILIGLGTALICATITSYPLQYFVNLDGSCWLSLAYLYIVLSASLIIVLTSPEFELRSCHGYTLWVIYGTYFGCQVALLYVRQTDF